MRAMGTVLAAVVASGCAAAPEAGVVEQPPELVALLALLTVTAVALGRAIP